MDKKNQLAFECLIFWMYDCYQEVTLNKEMNKDVKV